MDITKQLKDFIRFHIKKSRFGVILTNTKEVTEPITSSIDNLAKSLNDKNNDISNSEEITEPIIASNLQVGGALAKSIIDLKDEIKKEKIIKTETDFSLIEKKIDEVISVIEKSKTVVNVDNKDIIKALKKLRIEAPKMEKQKFIDYTGILNVISDNIENKEFDATKIIEAISKIVTTDDLGVISDYLQVLIDKKYPEFPEFSFTKDKRLKVEVDKVGGAGGGLSKTESEALISIPTKIDTVEANQDPLAFYKISDKDDDASPNYFGFVNADGSWYILKETVSAGADTYRYAAGSSSYTTNWTNRASLSFDHFFNVF